MDGESLCAYVLQGTSGENDLSGPEFRAVREALLQFKAAGGLQEEAVSLLQPLLAQVSEAQEDKILEILDIVTGFCTPDRSIG